MIHMVASYCWWWHYRESEQILLRSDYRQILWSKSSSKHKYAVSFWNLVALFPFLNGLGTSLLPSRVKNVVIGNGRRWFLYSKWELRHSTYGNFCKCDWSFSWFLDRAWGRGLMRMVGSWSVVFGSSPHADCSPRLTVLRDPWSREWWHSVQVYLTSFPDYKSVAWEWDISIAAICQYLSIPGHSTSRPRSSWRWRY